MGEPYVSRFCVNNLKWVSLSLIDFCQQRRWQIGHSRLSRSCWPPLGCQILLGFALPGRVPLDAPLLMQWRQWRNSSSSLRGLIYKAYAVACLIIIRLSFSMVLLQLCSPKRHWAFWPLLSGIIHSGLIVSNALWTSSFHRYNCPDITVREKAPEHPDP